MSCTSSKRTCFNTWSLPGCIVPSIICIHCYKIGEALTHIMSVSANEEINKLYKNSLGFSVLVDQQIAKSSKITNYNSSGKYSFLQVPPLSPPSPVLTSLEMSVEVWMSLWAGQWVVETMLISTSSTLPPTLLRPRMEVFWISQLVVSHSMNWLVSWQAMSTT